MTTVDKYTAGTCPDCPDTSIANDLGEMFTEKGNAARPFVNIVRTVLRTGAISIDIGGQNIFGEG